MNDRDDGAGHHRRPGTRPAPGDAGSEQKLIPATDRYIVTHADPERTRHTELTALTPAAADVTARELSREAPVQIILSASDGSRTVIASYADGRPTTVGSAAGTQPAAGPGEPSRLLAPPPQPAAARGGTAGPAADQITGLAAGRASGGLQRPHRLVHPDGAEVSCWPDGRSGPAWTGVAAGITPAPGEASGWLQGVLLCDGTVRVAHPAVIAPAGVNPYAALSYRDQLRFGAFDPAEAAGRDAAWLHAALVDVGDVIRAEMPARSGILDVREVTAVRTDGARVRITAAGLDGEEHAGTIPANGRVEVMLPAWHPAEDAPYAAGLFAPRPHQIRPPAAGPVRAAAADDAAALPDGSPGLAGLAARIAGHEEDLARLREAAAAAGLPRWQSTLSMGEALGRRPPPAGAGDGGDAHGWGEAAAGTGLLVNAQAHARQAIPGLAGDQAWRRVTDVTREARRMAGDAHAGRMRFADPAGALRAWRRVWARACEITGDLAAALMTRLRRGRRAWRAARRLHHAAAEAVAHDRGWLPAGTRLPPGSYTPPRGKTGRTVVLADLATQLHDRGAAPLGARDALTGLDFPGELSSLVLRDARPRTPARRAAGPPRQPAPAAPRS